MDTTMSEFHLEDYLQKLQASKHIDDCPKVPLPEIGKDQNYIFISYSHKDYKEVYYDLAHLYCQGVRFWYDKGLEAGEDWEKEVQANIQSPRCCGVVFYLSTNMFLSDSIFKEIEFTSAKKKPDVLLQKNYFCVNLQEDNISDMLFKTQEIQRKEGLVRLDTKKLLVLTSTFSDNDTYIKFNSSYHLDELIEQIQHKFDVTGKVSKTSANVWSLETIKDPRLAFFAISERETDPLPLFRFLLADFKRTKLIRPWPLLIIGVLIGIAAVLVAMHFLCTIPGLPLLDDMNGLYNVPITVLSFLLIPWLAAKIFWLFYISPFGRFREKGFWGKILNFAGYFFSNLVGATVATISSVLSFYLAFLIVNYLVKLFV